MSFCIIVFLYTDELSIGCSRFSAFSGTAAYMRSTFLPFPLCESPVLRDIKWGRLSSCSGPESLLHVRESRKSWFEGLRACSVELNKALFE